VALDNLGKVTLDEGKLIQHVLESNDFSWDSSRAIREMWDANWATYNNQFDFRDKLPFQSKNFLPKVKMAVRMMVSIIKQSMIKADQFFKFEGLNEDSKEVERDIEDTLMRVMDQARYKQKKFGRTVFLGLLENMMITKIYPKPLAQPPIHPLQDTEFVVQPVSAYDFRIDPQGRNRYVIHRVKMDLADYKRLARQGTYRIETIKELEEDFQEAEEEVREKIREGQIDVPKQTSRKEVELLEYWGDVDDVHGERILENITMTIVNRKSLARAPMKNPYRHGKPPFVWGPIFEKFGSVYHEGFVDGVLPLARMINENLNLTLDANTASSIKAFEVNLDFVHNPSALKSGIYPGKTIQTRGVPPGSQAIKEIQLGEVSQSAQFIQQFLDREFQNGTGINEFIGGFSTSGSKTATETKVKAGQSQSFTQSIAQNIEDNVLEPSIEMLYSLILQYNPELLGERVAGISADKLQFQFIAKGISEILFQQQDLAELFQWIGMVANTPIAQKLNWDSIGKASARLANQDPKKVFITETQQPPEVDQGLTRPQENENQNIINLEQQQLQGRANG